MRSSTTKVQANISKSTVENVNQILADLGQTPTSVINSLYHTIENTGQIPFKMALSRQQLNAIEIKNLAKNQPVTVIHNAKEFNQIWEGDDEDQ